MITKSIISKTQLSKSPLKSNLILRQMSDCKELGKMLKQCLHRVKKKKKIQLAIGFKNH